MASAGGDPNAFITAKLPTLLRFNRQGHVVSSDLGDYLTFNCDGTGKDRNCSLVALPSMSDFTSQSGGSDDSLTSYVDGVAMYAAINIVAFVLIIICTLFWILLGLFCLCLGCCGCKGREKSRWSPQTRYITSNVCLSMFIIIMFIYIILGVVLGSTKLFEFVSDYADAPSGAAQLYYQEMEPLTQLLIGGIGSVMVPLLSSGNTTISGSVNLYRLNEDIQQVNESFYDFPQFKEVGDILDSVSSLTTDAQGFVTDIINDLAGITNKTDAIRDAAEVIVDDLASIQSVVNNVTDALTVTTWLVNNVTATNTLLFTSNTGLVDEVTSDIATISRSSTAGDGFPLTTTFSDAATGGTDSVSRLLAGSYNSNNFAELQTFVSDVQSIYYAVAVLPDYDSTADDLLLINATIDYIAGKGGVVDQLVDNLGVLNSRLLFLPSFDEIDAHIDSLFAAITRISLTPITNDVKGITGLVDEIPGFINSLIDLVERVPPVIEELVPVLYDLIVARTAGFNASVMELPIDTLSTFNTLNKTLQSSLDTVNDVNGTLESSVSSVIDVNITYYLSLINKAQASYDSKVTGFNHTALIRDVNSMNTDLTGTNFTKYISEIQDMKNKFKTCYIPQYTITYLENLQTYRAALENTLQRVVSPLAYSGSTWDSAATRTGDYLLLQEGVCSGDTTLYCSATSTCSSAGKGTCGSIGAYRCSSNGVSSQAVVACTHDSDCSSLGGGSYCLADYTRAASLQANLTFFAQDILPNQAKVTSILTTLTNAKYDTSSVADQITDTKDSLGDVDVSSYLDTVNTTINGLNSFSMKDINSTLVSMRNSIKSINFSSFNDTLDTLQDKQKTALKSVSKYSEVIDGFTSFIYEPDQLRSYFNSLSFDSLSSYYDSTGSSGDTSRYIALQIQYMYDAFTAIFDPISDDVSVPGGENITKAFDMINDVFDRGTEITPSTYGSFYYLMSQQDTTRDQIVLADDPTAHSVTTNSDGNAYPNGTTCVTRACFDQTKKDLSTSPDTLPINIGLSVYQLAGLVWAPMSLMLLIAIWTALCPLCTKNHCLRGCPSTCMLIALIIMVPWYFIGTALLFPMTVVINDGCTTGTHVVNNYMTAMGDSLCDQAGGTGTLNACVQSSNGFNVTVDLEAVVNGFIGKCSGTDPFKAVILEMAGQVVDVINNKTETLVESHTFNKFRDPVANMVTDAGTNTGSVLYTFLDSTSDVIDCEGIASVFNGMRKPTCETFIGSLGWFASMLYLAAWTMCCCGIPAGCCVQHNHKWAEIESKSIVPTEEGASPEEGAVGEGEGGDVVISIDGVMAVNGNVYVAVPQDGGGPMANKRPSYDSHKVYPLEGDGDGAGDDNNPSPSQVELVEVTAQQHQHQHNMEDYGNVRLADDSTHVRHQAHHATADVRLADDNAHVRHQAHQVTAASMDQLGHHSVETHDQHHQQDYNDYTMDDEGGGAAL